MRGQARHCAKMIRTERQLARAAPSREAAEIHYQMVMLYRVQLKLLIQRLHGPTAASGLG